MQNKQRYISTSFWDDSWISELGTNEKLLYLYLLTNPLTNIAGVYKITQKRIAFDTGLKLTVIKEILDRFQESKKIFLYEEYLIIPAWPQHQKWQQRKKIQLAIISQLQELPKKLLFFLVRINYRFDMNLVDKTIIATKNRIGISGSRKKALIDSADGKCVKCGSSEKLVIHHKTAIENGGNNSDKNLQVLCEKCHLKIHKSYLDVQIPYVDVLNYSDSDLDSDSDLNTDLEDTRVSSSEAKLDDEVSQFVYKEQQEAKKVPYLKIIAHLNRSTHKQFSTQNKSTQRLLKARWNEGYRIPDFQAVIDVKAKQWLHDPKMVQYLRPQTLFGSKFEGYLNESKISVEQGNQEKRCPECGIRGGYHTESCKIMLERKAAIQEETGKL